jgi:hypothetical protein
MTTINEIDKLLHAYQAWLKDRTVLREVDGDWVEITTPYLDRHNDALQIYARRENGGYILSDDSYVIHDLEASGCDLETPKRQDLLTTTLNGFGVKRRGQSLEVHASSDTFSQRKHNLIQAMLAVNDLFYLAAPFVGNFFLEDVVVWLDKNDVRYTPKAKFTGVSGYDHLFNFVIPKSRNQPERILQAINRPTRDSALAFINAWSDTHTARTPESQAFAVLNDTDQAVSSGVVEALQAYKIRPVPWSERDKVVAGLAA